ncbi:acetate non-utilizing protein 9 [Sporothrix schenckii 1099-18]|uniref:Succinate dehydrogenase assembly factor 3 n=1 Tax=Sporothrix schenckii 1099-18 TaxID=1397361 RepID=A0A0F2M6S4_SPOSC|nr:acetate non-utilizing protein 9 [Sporothrix schenckii 1099-18]KJR84495.1 acetate non-utilizing protein 9 [Sporothrix schenckii 1099-18]
MRPSLRFLASAAASPKSGSLRPAPMALLPPIPLYRRLLRAHRKHLPHEMRTLGDEYIKAEFRAHRKVDNPQHLIGFLTEWQLYAQKIEGDSWVGEKLDPVKVAKMNGKFALSGNSLLAMLSLLREINENMVDQQVGQLYELMVAIRKHRADDGEDPSGQETA